MADSLIYPITTFSDAELQQYAERLESFNDAQNNIATGVATSQYIANDLARRYQLSREQVRATARVLMESVVGLTGESDIIQRLSETCTVPIDHAAAIAHDIESNILQLFGLSWKTISRVDEARASHDPEIITRSDGTEGLRYRSVDDLMADIEELEPDARMKFLDDAKRDNRIAVLVALSRLKLGSDANGNPLSFRTLLAREAPAFTATDWADALREDPDAIDDQVVAAALGMFTATPDRLAALLINVSGGAVLRALLSAVPQNPVIRDYLTHTPLAAMVAGRPAGEWELVVQRFAALPKPVRRRLCAPASATALSNLVSHGIVPATHTVAAARIIMFLATGELAPQRLEEVLAQLGVPPAQAPAMATGLLAVFGA